MRLSASCKKVQLAVGMFVQTCRGNILCNILVLGLDGVCQARPWQQKLSRPSGTGPLLACRRAA